MFALGISGLALVTFIAETTILQYMAIAGVKPDLVLIVVIYCAFSFRKLRAMTIGFFFGLIQDSLSYGLFGIHAILKCLTVLGIVMAKEKFLIEKPVVEYIISFSVIIFNCLLLAFLTQLLFGENRGSVLWDKALLMALYNSFLVPIIFYLIRRTRMKFARTRRIVVKL